MIYPVATRLLVTIGTAIGWKSKCNFDNNANSVEEMSHRLCISFHR